MDKPPPPPSIRCTNHATKRMLDRNIPWKSVQDTVLKPERTQPDPYPGEARTQAIKTIKGKTYVVVYRRESAEIVVITVYQRL